MRKSLLFSLLLSMLLGVTNAWADSGLFLFGKEVSSTSNWTYNTTNNIVGYISGNTPVAAIMNGTVSYDAATKTVTFNNVQAVVRDDRRILYNKGVPGLKIVFTGWATLWSDYCVFRLDQDTEIIGSEEEVNLRAKYDDDAQCIYCPNETKLTIRDFGKLKMTSERWRALHTKGTEVTIINSRVYAQGDDCAIQNDEAYFGAFHNPVGDLNLQGCFLRDPWYNYYGSVGEGYSQTEAGVDIFRVHTSKAKSVMIIRSEDYIGVCLKGVALTKGWSINEDTSNPSYGIEDYYTYDESTKTLTLEMDIHAKTGYNSQLREYLGDWVGIGIGKPITIEGNGHYVYAQRGLSCNDNVTLNNILLAGTEDGIFVGFESKLTLKDDIIIGGVESAIELYKDINDYSKGTVTFNPSFGKTITLVPCNSNFQETTSFEELAVDGGNSILESCIITEPEGVEYMKNYKYGNFILNDEYVKTKMVFTGVTEYGLKVAGTQVNSANASDILDDGGHFKYNASTKTLTVSNATLEDVAYGIENEIDGLNVNFVGASTFNTNRCTIYSWKPINLIGNGSLNATVTDDSSIILYGQGNEFTINGPQIDLTTNDHISIRSNHYYNTLNVEGNSTCLRIHPGNALAFRNFKEVNLGSNLCISEPAGGYYKPSLSAITVDGTNAYYGDVVIQAKPLGLSINGKEMTFADMNNVPGVLSGNAYITTDTSGELALVLDNATLEWNDASNALNLHSGDLTIKVLGDCVINASDHTGLSLSGNTTVTGGGTLTINSKWAAIENWEDTRFTVKGNTTLIAYSSDSYGYCDEGYDYEQTKSWFTIEGGGLFAAFGKYGPISFNNDRSIHFDSYTDVRYPVGGYLSGNYVYDADGDKMTNDWAVIGWDTQKTDELMAYLVDFDEKYFGFSINGTDMTAKNMNNVPGVESGSAYIIKNVSTDPVLVLDNATLNWNDANAALNLYMNYHLTINVQGDCVINAPDHIGLSISGWATVTGGGTLTINSKFSAVETFDYAHFTVSGGTKVLAHSSAWNGYNDRGDDDGALCTIESGCVFAAFGAGDFNPFSFGERSVTLGEGIGIRYPVSCQLWGKYVYYVSDDDYYEITNDWVVFGPDNQETQELIYKITNPQRNLGFSINGKEMTTWDLNDVPGVKRGRAYIELSASGAPTLVLDNATLEWDTTGYGLNNHDTGQDGLTIKALGDCTIKAPNAYAAHEIEIARTTTVEGGGTLNIISGKYPIETSTVSTLRIQDGTTVIAKSENGYSAVWDNDGANIEIRDGGMFAAFGKYEPIWLDSNGEFILGEGIALRYPTDAYIGSNNNIYYADGTKVTNDWVVIGPDNATTGELIDGVDNVNADDNDNLNANKGIYNLAGQKVGESYKGIVIKNGKKIIKL